MGVSFVAEVSSNHNGDLDRCLSFVREAKACGFDAVKFQLFRVEKLFSKEALEYNPSLKKRKGWELPLSFLPEISEICERLGIKFICTPFYLGAVDELFPFVDAYKVASYELLWSELLKKVASTGKPVILSSGMANLQEVIDAVNILVESGCKDITVLHCVSSYPVAAERCNLSAIETMRKAVKVEEGVSMKFGWSDHSVNEGVVLRAIHRWGAEMVEMHFDLDEMGAEYGFGHCWLPDKAKRLITMVREGFVADGDGRKVPQEVEFNERMWRADPEDGLRPMNSVREKLLKG
ncbi:MAG: N-acetylneuraminate synthase family protein [Synergistetes bacterium]|nr:N-acetylneuraminate synthase family protein [Synergistota bacterium]